MSDKIGPSQKKVYLYTPKSRNNLLKNKKKLQLIMVKLDNEIKIYHSVWKNGITTIGCLAFAVLGIVFLPEDGAPWLLWLCIVFFGLGGLFMAYMVIKEKITHRPYLIITDEFVKMNSGKGFEIRYADVDSFFLTRVGSAKMVGITYKKEIEAQKMDEAKEVGRAVRRFNTKIAGTQEAIPVFDLTMKPGEIVEILNERLIASNSH